MFSFYWLGIQGVAKLDESLQLATSTCRYDDTKTGITHDRARILTELLYKI